MTPQPLVGSSWKPILSNAGCAGSRISLGSPLKVVNGPTIHRATACGMADGDVGTHPYRGQRLQTIVGLGDPVMDILIHTDVQKIRDLGLESGGCLPLNTGETSGLVAALERAADQARHVPGGSAANVLKGLANLAVASGRSVRFIGMVGSDEMGRDYAMQLQEQRVEPRLLESTSGQSTATCLCLVTPGGERTMRTCLAAAADLSTPDLLPEGWSLGATLVHVEGYILYKPKLAVAALRCARDAGALVSMDLASFELVCNCWSLLAELLQEGLLDIVVCNEEEALMVAKMAGLAATGSADGIIEETQRYLLQHCKVSVVSRGALGAVARSADGEVGCSPACIVPLEDTIGAGDNFTAGFLHAYLEGAPLSVCTASGCCVGTAAVQSVGAQLSPDTWARVRAQMEELLGHDTQPPTHMTAA
eukprot:jgi/Botrbrau1/1847/Bobra.146_1s0041.1